MPGTPRIVPIDTTGLLGAISTRSAVASATSASAAACASSTPTCTKASARSVARYRTHHSWKWMARRPPSSSTTTCVSQRWSDIGTRVTPGCQRAHNAAVTSDSEYPASSILVRTRWVAMSRSPSPNHDGSAP